MTKWPARNVPQALCPLCLFPLLLDRQGTHLPRCVAEHAKVVTFTPPVWL